jgi:hypothetical protein
MKLGDDSGRNSVVESSSSGCTVVGSDVQNTQERSLDQVLKY